MGRFSGPTVVLVTEAADLRWANEVGEAVKVRSLLRIADGTSR